METASLRFAPVFAWMRRASVVCVCCVLSTPAGAAGTAVGTQIENTAVVNYDVAGTPLSLQSNTTTITVAERINVTVTLQNAQVLVSPGDAGQALLFSVTNTGNGSETFTLSMDSVLPGDNFDPIPAVPSIYFDTDGSGDFNAGDVAYTPGVNDPVLAADESVSVFVVNDIPGGVANGDTGLSELTATSATGSGAPGTVFANQGDGGVNAMLGSTGGTATVAGEYLVSNVLVNVTKAQVVNDPFGGNEPVPGATLNYTITVSVASAGTATASTVQDAVPALTTFVPDSILLNGAPISDATDGDAGEYDTSVTPTVVVRLGDLTQAMGPQSIEFQVIID